MTHLVGGDNTTRLHARTVVRVIAWSIAILALLNVLYFVLRAANPVFRDDDWYFLDVFLRKAVDGTLGISDFFVKRAGADHAQPLFKLVLLGEWRYLGGGLTAGAVLGVLAAAGCALIYLQLFIRPKSGQPVSARAYVAWAATCALLFSLNGGTANQWTWPLTALENITTLIILLFLLAVWHAHKTRRYTLLILATLFLCVSSDDSALVGVVAAILALLVMQFSDPAQRNASLWKVLLAIVVCTVAVRIGYQFTPVVGGVPTLPFGANLRMLSERFSDQGWWMWVVYPLTLPVSDGSPFHSVGATAWLAIVIVMALILLAAHVWFWRKAFGHSYGRTKFIAVATMLVTYGWIAGIVLHRVSVLGNYYIAEPRYPLLYSGQLIALLLMWIATRENVQALPSRWRAVISQSAPIIGCLILLLVQIPISVNDWHAQPYINAYSAMMAHQIDKLAKDPMHTFKCVPELPVCSMPAKRRVELTRLLSRNRKNVFSPKVQARHPYLPRLQPVSIAPPSP